jgi:hypothetical protein
MGNCGAKTLEESQFLEQSNGAFIPGQMADDRVDVLLNNGTVKQLAVRLEYCCLNPDNMLQPYAVDPHASKHSPQMAMEAAVCDESITLPNVLNLY